MAQHQELKRKRETVQQTAKPDVPPPLKIELPKNSDLPKESRPWSIDHLPLPVDILLLTVDDCEFLACYAYMTNSFKSYHQNLGYVYFGNMGESKQKPLKVALLKCSEGSSTPGGSQTVTKNAVTQLRPKVIYSVGCCEGLNPEDTKLGDVVISSKLTTEAFKTPVGKNIGNLIKYAADGWNPPLKSPEVREVQVHRDSEILSGIDPDSAKRHRVSHSEAIASESQGKGIFVAAHDLKIEWVVVKGISHFADDINAPDKSWKSHACVMAASLVSSMLSDPVVFQDWPHYEDNEQMRTEVGNTRAKLDTLRTMAEEKKNEGDFDLINQIRQLYTSREGWLAPFPWCEDFQFHIDNIFTRLVMVNHKKDARATRTRNVVDMFAIFQPHEECAEPKKVLIEGKPGMGKTTYCNKVSYDWATKKRKAEDYFPDFQLVLSLKCRDIGNESDLWDAIDDQLLPREIQEDEKKKFFEFIRQNQCHVLLILDGLDELPTSELPKFSEIIQGRVLPGCHVVVTARQEAGIPIRKVCNTLLEIEGFTLRDAKDFIAKYFKTKENLAEKLLHQLDDDRNLQEMVANPLNTALLCLLCEDFQGIPDNKTQLYLEIVQCVLMRYKRKNGLPVNSEDLTEVYKSPLKHLGSIALKGLLEDNMYFVEQQLGGHTQDLPGFGFLSVQPASSKRRPSVSYAFLHKSFQELFAAFYICCQLLSKELTPEMLVDDPRYFHGLEQVLVFTSGMLALKSEQTAVALIKSIANEVNKDELTRDYFPVALECIKECKKEQSDFHGELAQTFGSCLKVHAVDFFEGGIGAACASVLGLALETNATLTELRLVGNNLGPAGAKALAGALKINSTLTKLVLSADVLGPAVVEALADGLKSNTSLTELIMCKNNLGPAGAKALTDLLQTNTTLKELDLYDNNLGPPDAKALAKGLKTNTTLTVLKLAGNNLGPAAAKALADGLKTNTTLTALNLADNNLGLAAAKALADGLKTNTTLTALNLADNNLGPAAAKALADGLKTNTTLTDLYLHKINLGPAGAKALADLLKTNTTLTVLNLADSNLGPAGGKALADRLKTKTALTELYLSSNNLGLADAKALADLVKTNTTLTKLDLSFNNLGPAGAKALADGLKTNTTLTELYLSDNNLGPAGAKALAHVLKTNTTLTDLHLCDNNLGPAGAKALADGLKTNTTLTELIMCKNNLGPAGAKALADGLKTNTTLTDLYLSSNNLGPASAKALADLLETNTTLTLLYLDDNNLGPDGVKALAGVLKTNTTLVSLCLSYNNLFPASAALIDDVLNVNSTLTELLLYSDDVSGAVAVEKLKKAHGNRVCIR